MTQVSGSIRKPRLTARSPPKNQRYAITVRGSGWPSVCPKTQSAQRNDRRTEPQPSGGSPGSGGNNEQGHDRARGRVRVGGKRHGVEVGPVQHDLDAHEHDDEVPPDAPPDEPRHEEDRADRHIRPDGYHRYSLNV